MKRYTTVEDYILGHQEWQAELELLRDSLLKNNDLKEEVKWGAPIYTVGGKNVMGIGTFKAYIGLWFHQGVFLSDGAGVLINAQEGKTKALRQWRFTSIDEIDINLVEKYIDEAVKNQLAGKEMKPERKSDLNIPSELKNILDTDKKIAEQFASLTLYKQKEYSEYIESAKRAETKESRLEKIIPMIRAGKGLNDKYR